MMSTRYFISGKALREFTMFVYDFQIANGHLSLKFIGDIRISYEQQHPSKRVLVFVKAFCVVCWCECISLLLDPSKRVLASYFSRYSGQSRRLTLQTTLQFSGVQ